MKRFAKEFWIFGLKQVSASIFGGALLLAILLTEYSPWNGGMHRYDMLFLIALCIQGVLIATRMEEPKEIIVILVFHIVATLMELFKTSDGIGAWYYPGVQDAYFTISNVPLFAGFMYSAVGSYIARSWRIFNFQFERFPPLWISGIVSALIYFNFFTHHILPDIRYLLLVIILLLFGRTFILFRVVEHHWKMPYIVGIGLVALFIWIAENVSTFGTVWLYPNQIDGWAVVPIAKVLSWFLLLIVSFVLVAVVHKSSMRAAVRTRAEISSEIKNARD